MVCMCMCGMLESYRGQTGINVADVCVWAWGGKTGWELVSMQDEMVVVVNGMTCS